MAGPLATRLARRNKVAPDVMDLDFRLDPPGRIDFRGGQFVTLAVGNDAQGQPIRRSYSIASPSDEGDHLRLLVKVLDEGCASDFFLGLPINAPVAMTGAHGFFTLDAQHPGDIVFAVTGTGLAPMLPMLRELHGQKKTGRRLLFWGLRDEGDLFLRDDITALCAAAEVEFLPYLSRPGGAWQLGRGRITAPVLDLTPGLTAPIYYLVGNGAMIRELKSGLLTLGVDRKKQIRTEAFFD